MADLQSKAFAQVVDLICEGPIEGLVNGLNSVFLDEVRVQDGAVTNVTGVTLQSRTGTNSQTYIEGFAAVENEIAVNTELKNSGALTRTVSGPDVNAVRVKIVLPALFRQNSSTGAFEGLSVSIGIDVKANDENVFTTKISDTITGRALSRYQRDYLIRLTGTGPWVVRLRRTSADSTDAKIQDKTYWDSYTEIIDSKLRYPNSALVALRFDSEKFAQLPRRAYDMKLLRIKVPTNYDPLTRNYNGVWDGTFKTAWTDNPAWVLYDMLTAERYGLGGFVAAAQVDKWALYSAAQYCDQMVSNGNGGVEPRFTCNVYIQNQQEAYKVVQDLASVFRGMVYWSSGALSMSQDRPGDSVYLYTPANVSEGQFTYSGASLKARHTVALVTWNDPADFYRQKVEYVEDAEAIARYGLVTTDITAFGCTSRGQAQRVGRWLLYAERYESEVITFKTGLEATLARPGQIISVADPVRAGKRMGGRIVGATASTITVDAIDILPANTTHTIAYIKANGTTESRQVSTVIGPVVSVVTPFSETPAVNGIWMLTSNVLAAQTFRVLTVTEEENGVFTISALAHNPNKYVAIENGISLQEAQTVSASLTPTAPQNLVVTESMVGSGLNRLITIDLSWQSVPGATGYYASYKANDNNFINLPITNVNNVQIAGADPGAYTFNVYAVNALGTKSPVSTIGKIIFGALVPPADVAGFSLVPNAGQALLSWNRAVDQDVQVGGFVRIRHSPSLTNATWANSIDLLPSISGGQTSITAPLLTGTYLAKFYDSSDIPSNNAATITTQAPDALGVNVVTTTTQHPTFSGTKTNCQLSGSALKITNTALAAEYLFASTVDLSEVYTSRVTARVVANGIDENDLIDSRVALIDSWVDIDGESIETVNAELYFRTTEDNPASPTAVWTAWKPFFVSDYRARAFQFKLRMTSSFATHNILISELSVTVDMPDRVEGERNITSGVAVKNVIFPNAFYATPTIGVTAYAMNTGDYFEVTNQSATGFSVVFKDSAGAVVSRTFDYIAKGYGRRI